MIQYATLSIIQLETTHYPCMTSTLANDDEAWSPELFTPQTQLISPLWADPHANIYGLFFAIGYTWCPQKHFFFIYRNWSILLVITVMNVVKKMLQSIFWLIIDNWCLNWWFDYFCQMSLGHILVTFFEAKKRGPNDETLNNLDSDTFQKFWILCNVVAREHTASFPLKIMTDTVVTNVLVCLSILKDVTWTISFVNSL